MCLLDLSVGRGWATTVRLGLEAAPGFSWQAGWAWAVLGTGGVGWVMAVLRGVAMGWATIIPKFTTTARSRYRHAKVAAQLD